MADELKTEETEDGDKTGGPGADGTADGSGAGAAEVKEVDSSDTPASGESGEVAKPDGSATGASADGSGTDAPADSPGADATEKEKPARTDEEEEIDFVEKIQNPEKLCETDDVVVKDVDNFFTALYEFFADPTPDPDNMERVRRIVIQTLGIKDGDKQKLEQITNGCEDLTEAVGILCQIMLHKDIRSSQDVEDAEVEVKNQYAEAIDGPTQYVENELLKANFVMPLALLESTDVEGWFYDGYGRSIPPEEPEEREQVFLAQIIHHPKQDQIEQIVPFILQDIEQRVQNDPLYKNSSEFKERIGSILAYVGESERSIFLEECEVEPWVEISIPDPPSDLDFAKSYLWFYPDALDRIDEEELKTSPIWLDIVDNYEKEKISSDKEEREDSSATAEELDPDDLIKKLIGDDGVLSDYLDSKNVAIVALNSDSYQEDPYVLDVVRARVLYGDGDRDKVTLPEDWGLPITWTIEGNEDKLPNWLNKITPKQYELLSEEDQSKLDRLHNYFMEFYRDDHSMEFFRERKIAGWSIKEDAADISYDEMEEAIKIAYVLAADAEKLQNVYSKVYDDDLKRAKESVQKLLVGMSHEERIETIKKNLRIPEDSTNDELAHQALLAVYRQYQTGEIKELSEDQVTWILRCLKQIKDNPKYEQLYGNFKEKGPDAIKKKLENKKWADEVKDDNPPLREACWQLTHGESKSRTLGNFSEYTQDIAILNLMEEWQVARRAYELDPNQANELRYKQLDKQRKEWIKEQRKRPTDENLKVETFCGTRLRLDAGWPFATGDLMGAALQKKGKKIFNVILKEVKKKPEAFKPEMVVTYDNKLVVKVNTFDPETNEVVTKNIVISQDNLENLGAAIQVLQEGRNSRTVEGEEEETKPAGRSSGSKTKKNPHKGKKRYKRTPKANASRIALGRIDKILLEDMPVVRGRLTKSVEGEYVYEFHSGWQYKTEEQRQYEKKHDEEIAQWRAERGLSPRGAHTTEALSRAGEKADWLASFSNEELGYSFQDGRVVWGSGMRISDKHYCVVDFLKAIKAQYPDSPVPHEICDAYYKMVQQAGNYKEDFATGVVLFQDNRYSDHPSIQLDSDLMAIQRINEHLASKR